MGTSSPSYRHFHQEHPQYRGVLVPLQGLLWLYHLDHFHHPALMIRVCLTDLSIGNNLDEDYCCLKSLSQQVRDEIYTPPLRIITTVMVIYSRPFWYWCTWRLTMTEYLPCPRPGWFSPWPRPGWFSLWPRPRWFSPWPWSGWFSPQPRPPVDPRGRPLEWPDVI